MLRLGWRRRVGGGLAAQIGVGVGVFALVSGMGSDGAAARSRSESGKREATVISRPVGPPVMIVVSLNQQRVTVYDADGPMLHSSVSSGKPGYDTPVGIYTVLQRKVEHYSNLYDDAAMPFMQRLTWSGVALHAGMLPGYPASAGCVRMPISFAESLFERTKLGMRVIVVRDDIAPVVGFSHPALFKPISAETALLPGAPGSTLDIAGSEGVGRVTQVADTAPQTGTITQPRSRASLKAAAAAKSEAAAAAVKKAEDLRLAARSATLEAGRARKLLRRAEGARKRAESQLRQAEKWAGSRGASERAHKAKAAAEAAFAAADTKFDQAKAELQPKIDLAAKLRAEVKEAAEASKTATEESRVAARKLAPISVFISRATQRLYVRQAREPLFDAPITIADSNRRLGTYVFTALSYTRGETDLRWSVVSMYAAKAGPGTRAARRRDRRARPVATDQEGARAALDRIAIPKESVDRIAELMAPGASLIVSDEGISRETGAATEFIVLMSGEPQGGIKIRRPPGEARVRSEPRVRSEARLRRYRAPPSTWGGWSGPSPFSLW